MFPMPRGQRLGRSASSDRPAPRREARPGHRPADGRSLAGLIRQIVAVLAGVLLGLVFTVGALDRSTLGASVGPWRAGPREDSGASNPYSLAAIARSALLPLGAAEGLTFVAATASDGSGLRSRCDYAISGPVPLARYWTLSLLDRDGYPVGDGTARHGFTSAEVLRTVNDAAVITVSPEARAGNWLPTGGIDRFVLMLRLYDTGLSAVGAVLDAGTMPTITMVGCR